jgi:GNAT superfamily N-acetyltransferase
MESTEHPLAEHEHPLGAEHLAGCVALSRSANWNQNEADWRLMLDIGRGWGLSSPDGMLVASTLVLPYGDFAWVSMVLVHPGYRRRGYATQLLRTAIADLEHRDLTPILDATPAGHAVYSQEGFRDRWGFRRFFLRERKPPQAGVGSARLIRHSDWNEILRQDLEAFGASRERLLRALWQRLPEAAWIVEGKGFILGRDGREARQVGPLIARDDLTARALLSHALRPLEPPLYVDAADHSPLAALLEASGFEFQRPFTRMVHGSRPAPGNERLVHCVAGPELG